VSDAEGRRRPAGDALPAAVVALVALGVAAYLFLLGRGLVFFFDEWNFVLERRTGWFDALFAGHNGHPSMFPVLVYRGLFALVGLEHYGAFRLAVIVFHLLCAAALYVTARRRCGPWPAAVLASSLLLFGRAWEDLLWPFQVGYLASVLGAIGATWAIDRRAWKSTALFALLAVASSGIGAAVVAGVTVELVVQRAWRQLWVAVVPGLAFVVWTLRFGDSQAKLSNLRLVPRYAADALAGVLGALTGLESWGAWIGGGLLVAVAAAVWSRRVVPPGLAFAVAGGAAFWGLTALARGELGGPTSSRYLYPGAVFVLLALTTVIRAERLRPAPIAAAAALVAFASWTGLEDLRNGASALRSTSTAVAAQLRAIEETASVVPDDFRPDLARMPQVFAGPYLEAVEDLGSPAMPLEDVRTLPASLRREADNVVVAAAGPRATEPVAGAPTACRAGTDAAIPLPGAGVVAAAVATPVEVRLRLFGSEDVNPVAVLQPGQRVLVRGFSDARGWTMSLRPAGAATVCDLP
jgi:hypothetical protein